MARFGGYETTREVFRSGLATVWAARPAEAPPDSPSEYVVKEFRPLDSLPGDEGAAEVELFLEAAEVQRKATEAGAAHWAGIVESGRCPGGAYYVSRFYQRSLHQLIASRVRFSSVGLGTLLESIVAGLRELQQACARPHGDLKPSNVLVETAGDITRTQVVLADPLATSQLPRTAGEAADVRAVGHLIFGLVLHRRFEHGSWPIAKSEEWRRLGRRGEAWRQLCQDLLDPDAPPERLTLEWLGDAVARIHRGKRLAGRLVAVAVVLAVLGVGGWFGYQRLRRPIEPETPPFDTARWRRFCTDFYNWFGPLHGSLNASRREGWRGDEALARLVDAIEGAEQGRVALDPRDVVEDRTAVPLEMAEKPPAAAQSPEGVERTVAALKVIDAVRQGLRRDQWPTLQATADVARQWRDRRWNKPAAYLGRLVDAIDPPGEGGAAAMPDPQVARYVDRVLAVHDELLPPIRANDAKLREAQKTLDGSGDRILQALGAYWRRAAVSEPGRGTEEDLRQLQQRLGELAEQAGSLATFVQGDWQTKVHRELFQRGSSVHRSFDGTVTKHTIRLWRDQVRDYYRLEAAQDPRTAEPWDKRLTQIATNVATLERSPKAKEAAAEYARRLADEVRPAVAALRKMPAVVKTEAALQKEAAEVKARLDALDEEVARATIVYMGEPRDWLEGILRFEFKGSAVVNAEWKRRRGQLLVNITAEELEAKLEKYGALRGQVRAVRQGLAQLEGDSGLPRTLPEQARRHGARSWYNAFATRLAERREQTLEAALGVLPWEGVAPKLDDPEFETRWKALTADYRAFRDGAAEAIVALAAVEAGLDDLYLLDQTPPGLDQPLGEAFATWAGKPVLKDATLRQAVEPIAGRVAALRKVAATADRVRLLLLAGGAEQSEVALAAWRRLGTLDAPAWPGGEDELKADGELQARLLAELEVVRDEARRKTLRQSIAEEASRRQQRWLALKAQKLRQHLQQAQAAIEGAGDKVLARFGAYVEAELGRAAAEGTKAELAKLTEIQQLADRIVTFLQREWRDNIDQAKFARESQVHRTFDGTVTRQTLTAWLGEVERYRKATAEEVVAAIKATKRVAESPAVNAAWVKRRDLALLLNPLPRLKAEGELLSAVRAKVEALQAFLAGMDDAAALPKGLSAEARAQFPDGVQAALAKLLASRREKALGELAGRVPWGEDGFPAVRLQDYKASDAWKAVTGRYTAFRDGMVAAMKEARRIPAYLDAGYLPDDTPQGAEKTVAELYAQWRQFRQAVPPLRQALPGLDERMAVLAALEGLHRDELVARARSLQRDAPPQVPLIVWKRLGTVVDWPANLEELELEAQLRQRVAAVAERLGAKHPHAVRWVEPALRKESPRRWEVCFCALLPKEAPTEADEAKVARALGVAAKLGVETRWLRPPTQFRIALIELRGKLFALADKGDKDDAAHLLGAFQRKVSALPDVAQSPAVLQFFGQALDILKKADGGAGGGLDRIGPAVYPHAGGWKAQPTADGRAVTYTWAKGPSLQFVLVDPTQGQGRPTYLCTTEVSLGLFIDAVGEAKQWREVMRLVKRYDLIADPRKGPRVWELTRDRKAIQPSREWLVRLPGVRRPYPNGLSPARPAGEHPLQYVSPAAALFVARVLGCRLPTAAEWRAAAAQAKGRAANLRDATWKRQQAHVRGLWAGGVRADWPDAGIFLPTDAEVAFEGNAGTVSDRADGVLWFAPGGSGSGFHHLVGNVAEFVFEEPGAFEAAFQDAGGLTADGVRAFLGKHKAMLAVIGGSALSAPEVWNGREKAFGAAWPAALDEVRDGLSDVGFRLAFTAPTVSPVARLKRFVRRQGYMMQVQ